MPLSDAQSAVIRDFGHTSSVYLGKVDGGPVEVIVRSAPTASSRRSGGTYRVDAAGERERVNPSAVTPTAAVISTALAANLPPCSYDPEAQRLQIYWGDRQYDLPVILNAA